MTSAVVAAGSVIADRFPKRRLRQLTQLTMALASLVLGLLAVAGVAQVWEVYLIAFLFGIGSAFDAPARQSFVSEMVGPDDLILVRWFGKGLSQRSVDKVSHRAERTVFEKAFPGGMLEVGGLRLTALWPPRELLHDTDQDPNLLCLVLVARWRHFSMLLTGDAEAETHPLRPSELWMMKERV